MLESFRPEIDAALKRDPAAHSRGEVLLCYPGLHALMFHRLSHRLWRANWRLLARWLSQLARHLTGVEIHPAARIGRGVFIDHGIGVVVGETAEIGDNVTLYQGVTLGGLSPAIESHNQVNLKRHPTIGEGAIIGSGAQILGPCLVGAGARVGSNAVVVKDIPPGATVVGIPARLAGRARLSEAKAPEPEPREFAAYGLPGGQVADPVSRLCDELVEQVEALSARVKALEAELEKMRAAEADARGRSRGLG
jgi:serine O-acetyltransferase